MKLWKTLPWIALAMAATPALAQDAQAPEAVTETFEGQKFFTMRYGVRYMSPLFLVLLLIESTDLIFAVDSIPAIYSVTDDPTR